MADKKINVRFQQRTDKETAWASADPVLLFGEMAISSDNGYRYKIGDGVSTWSQLKYASSNSANILSSARYIDGVSFDGSQDIVHYGVCSTTAGTVAKTVPCIGFVLKTGSRIVVKFTVTNTTSNPTLNVNNTGAKPVYYQGSAITASFLAANKMYEFIYDGTNYNLVGDVNTNTDTKVINTLSPTTKAYVTGTTSATTNTGTQVFDTGVYLDTEVGQLTASTFKGSLLGNATSATKSTNDSLNNPISSTYIKDIIINNNSLDYVKGDGTTGVISDNLATMILNGSDLMGTTSLSADSVVSGKAIREMYLMMSEGVTDAEIDAIVPPEDIP